MKRKKILSMMGALTMLFGITLVISGCNHATGANKSTDGKQNNTNSMEVKPTGPADPELKGTVWGSNSIQKEIMFDQNVNTVLIVIAGIGQTQATYAVKDSIVAFDLSQQVAIEESLTVDKHIQERISGQESSIARLKEEIAKGNNVEQLKKWLKEAEEELEQLKNPTPEYKAELEEEVASIKERAKNLKQHAKFTGKLNPAKTELTVDEYPVYDYSTKTFTVKKIVLQKQ